MKCKKCGADITKKNSVTLLIKAHTTEKWCIFCWQKDLNNCGPTYGELRDWE